MLKKALGGSNSLSKKIVPLELNKLCILVLTPVKSDGHYTLKSLTCESDINTIKTRTCRVKHSPNGLPNVSMHCSIWGLN
jgi:hypothetical protein